MKSARKQQAVTVAAAPIEVPGLAYHDRADALGLRFFRCQPYSTELSTRGCGQRWSRAQGGAGDAFAACLSCPLGASHAGSRHIDYSQIYAAPICPRCRFGATRIIGNRICVNCYNREREMVSGKNARGNAPTTLLRERPLHTVRFRVVIDGKPEARTADGVVDLLEPMMQILRTTKGKISFSFVGAEPRVRQRDLFAAVGITGGRRAPGMARHVRRPAGYASAIDVQLELFPACDLGRRPAAAPAPELRMAA